MHHLNNCLPSTKLKADISTSKILFLDVTNKIRSILNPHNNSLYETHIGMSIMSHVTKDRVAMAFLMANFYAFVAFAARRTTL